VFTLALVCLCLFVYLFVNRLTPKKNCSTDFREFGGKLERGPLKKPLDFGGSRDLLTLGLGKGYAVVKVVM